MSSMLEQSARELALLKGAKVTSVKEVKGEDDFAFLRITFKLARAVADADNGDRPCTQVSFDVLADPEGNGPGFLSLSELLP